MRVRSLSPILLITDASLSLKSDKTPPHFFIAEGLPLDRWRGLTRSSDLALCSANRRPSPRLGR